MALIAKERAASAAATHLRAVLASSSEAIHRVAAEGFAEVDIDGEPCSPSARAAARPAAAEAMPRQTPTRAAPRPPGSPQKGWEDGAPAAIVVDSSALSQTLLQSDQALVAAYVNARAAAAPCRLALTAARSLDLSLLLPCPYLPAGRA